MQLVLHGFEEGLGDLGALIVVDARGVDVGDLLVEQPLGRADVANAGKQLLKVILPDSSSRLDALVVEDEAFDEKLSQLCGGPLAELSASRRADPIAQCEDHVEVVVRH